MTTETLHLRKLGPRPRLVARLYFKSWATRHIFFSRVVMAAQAKSLVFGQCCPITENSPNHGTRSFFLQYSKGHGMRVKKPCREFAILFAWRAVTSMTTPDRAREH